MNKTILITGSTDGIGFEAAKKLAMQGHHILLHGRNRGKLEQAKQNLHALTNVVPEAYTADLSSLAQTAALARTVSEHHPQLDVLINNAGVLKAPHTLTPDGFDIRFMVNSIAPYLLSKALLPQLGSHGRVINLSSAAQAPVSHDALLGKQGTLEDMAAYSQSKLAITMWTRSMAQSLGDSGPVILAVNPGSLLASKMVKEGFGIDGKDLSIGADILVRLALDNAFAGKSGAYFDNDAGEFALPHPSGQDLQACHRVAQAIESVISSHALLI